MTRRHPRPARSGWQRRTPPNPETTPSTVLDALKGRVLDNLERCRIAWQAEADPMALVVAVAGAGLPDWLTDALIIELLDDTGRRARRWKARGRHMADRARVESAASVKALRPDVPWDVARGLAERRVQDAYDDVGHVGDAAHKKAWRAVSRGVDAHPGRYYVPPANFSTRIDAAFDREIERRETAAKKDTEPTS